MKRPRNKIEGKQFLNGKDWQRTINEYAKKVKINNIENNIRFSVNHPYFKLVSHEKLARIRMLDILAAVVETIKNEFSK